MSLKSEILDRLPYIGRLRADNRALRASMGRFPAGHFYSPIPSETDVRRHLKQLESPLDNPCPDIELNPDAQFALLQAFAEYYPDVRWRDEQQAGLRYYFGQEMFCYADAIYLYSHLRHTPPSRIVEVGSGFSSALMLDTAEHFLSARPAITFIEPHPERLHRLLRPDDQAWVTVIEDEVQNVPRSVFSALGAGDLLFIDSSHVVKAGSDLLFLFFHVIPHLPPGVIVHFHDVFYPFDYIPDWFAMGRYWNEVYFLRAFLAYNAAWRIRFFGSYVGIQHQEYLAQHMPWCLQNPGGSIYIERESS
ncbi:MAG: class I SAM-dependent methyltransferase [Chloroflexi bacterium]|nr:class I SAM-dependent methyltransferase [Chloroflexota bacterium]